MSVTIALGRSVRAARRDLTNYISCRILPALIPKIACGQGCAWCCNSAFAVSSAEVVAAVLYVHARIGPALTKVLTDKLRAYTDALIKSDAATFRRPCPFLMRDNSCVIYAARPLICAGYVAQDAAVCERSAKDPTAKAAPVSEALGQTQILVRSLVAKSARAGLRGDVVMFVPAVLDLLEHPRRMA